MTPETNRFGAPRWVEDETTGCWVWAMSRSVDGYGVWAVNRRGQRAHRVSYERFVGPIPVGMELDHLCRNRACVNPAHLEPVTHAENSRRGTAGLVGGARQQAKTRCPKGHPYDATNTYWYAGRRQCKTCRQARDRNRHGS